MIRSVREKLKNNSPKKGFTLVELIVVLVILAILAAVAVPALLGWSDDAKEKSYKTDADAALKASQTVITEVYNDGGNLLDSTKRYKAWEMAGIDNTTGGYVDGCSEFKVWTGKQLVTNVTPATSDNIASYTVMYAQYKIPSKDGKKVLFYNGKEWKVFDDEDALTNNQEYNNIMASYSDNVIYMWPNYSTQVAYEDTAHGTLHPDDKEWYERDDSDPKEVTVTLHVFKKHGHGVVFESGADKPDTIKVKFTRDEDNNVTNTWSDKYTVAYDNKEYKIAAEKGYVFQDKWAVNSADSTETLEYGNGEGGIFSGVNIDRIFKKKIKDLYAVGYQDYETRKVKFHAFNVDSLWFLNGENKIGEVEVEFRRYKPTDYKEEFEYEDCKDIINSSGTEIGACDWKDFSAAKYNQTGGYEFSGWALSPTGELGNYKTDENGIVPFDALSTIWKEVFDAPEAGVSDYMFVGILERVQTVKLCRDADKHSSFVDYSGDELEFEIHTKELTGDTSDNLDGYNDHKLVADNGYRHKGWNINTTVEGSIETIKVENSIGSIRLYISAHPDESEYVFTAIIEEGARTKFIANSNSDPFSSTTGDTNEGTFAGQIYYMSKGNRSNLKTFQRINYNTAVSMFTVDENGNGKLGNSATIIEGLDDDKIGNDKAVYCNGSHWKRYDIDADITGVGHVYRFYILWDGRKTADEDEPEYDIPLFAYSIKSGNDYHIKWFSRENSPELPGNFNGLFQNYNNLSFVNSDISNWDTSACTGMACMFDNTSLGNYQIDFSKLDYSSVKTMERMFDRNTVLTTIAMSGRSMNNVTTMKEMFKRCTALKEFHMLNTELKSLTDVTNMFYNANVLETVEISGTDMRKVTNLTGFIGQVKNANGAIDASSANIKYFYAKGWNISSVTSLSGLFTKGSYEGPYENIINGSSTTDIGYSKIVKADFSGADLSSVTNFEAMFKRCPDLNFVSFEGAKMCGKTNVDITMKEMFYHCFILRNINLRIGTEIHPTNFFKMFDYCLYLENIEMETAYNAENDRVMATKFCSERVTTMQNMFYNNGHQTEQFYRYFDYSSCQTTQKMFRGTVFGNERDGFTSVSFAGISMPKLTNMEEMFMQSWVDTVSFEDCNLSKVTNVKNLFLDSRVREVKFDRCNFSAYSGSLDTMFGNNPNLEKFTGSEWDARKVKNLNSLFKGSGSLKEVDLSNSNFSTVTSLSAMFMNCSALTKVDISGMTLGKVTDMSQMFYECEVLADLPLSNLNFQYVKTLKQTFYNCKALKTLDLSSWSLSSLTSFEQTFYGLDATSISIANNSFNNLTSVNKMFENAKISTLVLDNCKMNKVATFPGGMFDGATISSISAKGWELKNTGVTSMKNLFAGNTDLIDIDFTNAQFPYVTDLSGMFKNCTSVTSITLTGMSLGHVTDMSEMFSGCTGMSELPMSDLNLSYVTTLSKTFYNCTAITENPIANLSLNNVTDMSYTFYGCTGITDFAIESMGSTGTVAGKKQLPLVTTMAGMLQNTNAASISFENLQLPALTTVTDLMKDSGVQTVSFDGCEMSAVTANPSTMFAGCNSMTSFSAVGWDVQSITSVENMFNGRSALTSVDLTNAVMSKVTSVKNMFVNTAVTDVTLKNCDMSALVNAKLMVTSNNTIKNFDAEGWKIPNVADLSQMFMNNKALETVSFKDALTKPDGADSKLKLLNQMFQSCSNLQEAHMGCTDFSSVTTMNSVFLGCTKLTDVDGFEDISVKSLTDAQKMFQNCTSLESITFTIYSDGMADRTKTTGLNMGLMFDGCTSLTSVRFTGTKAGTEGTCVAGILTWQALFNNCTSYDIDSLMDTLSNINFDTDVKPAGDNYLFYNNCKNSVGYNSLFNQGACHDSLNALKAEGGEIIIHTEMGYDVAFRAYNPSKPSEKWIKGGETRLCNLNQPNPN